MSRKLRSLFVVCALVSSTIFTVPAQADSLLDAMRLAYETNPTLVINRAALRTTDESVAQTRAARRPSLALTSSANFSQSPAFNSEITDRYSIALNASLTIYDGGRSRDAIAAATESVMAARASLSNAEQSVMLDAATAYLTVRRDQQLVALARNNINVLKQQLQAAEDRFAVGAVTRTDVAQTQARLAAAQSNLAASRGALAISSEVYRATVGVAPINLIAPPALPRLPGSLAAAEEVALRTHPLMTAAHHAEKSAAIDMRRARAARLPNVSATASLGGNYVDNFLDEKQWDDSLTLGITASIPIYTGGALSSAIRQAGSIVERRFAETQNTRVVVRQNTAAAWYQLQIARASIVATRLQIEASQYAYEGIQEEASLGARTLLDTLDAEQDLLNARTSLISALHQKDVAAYKLLAAMGLLTPENLELGIELYDPSENFNRILNAPISTFEAARVLDGIADRWN